MKTKLTYLKNIFLHPKLWWDSLWENSVGTLWCFKWKIIDGWNSKFKRTIKIDTLDKTWYDKDEIMLHACFQLLVDYMEKEQAPRIVDFWSEEPCNADCHNLAQLYFWWTKIRPKRVDPWDEKWFEGVKCPTWEDNWVPKEETPNGQVYQFTPKEEEFSEYWELLELAGEMCERYSQEDQEKLELLIKCRLSLWC